IAEVHHCGKKISLRCGDGLSVLSPGEVDTIAICGMGGQLMIEILQAGDDVLRKTKRLILQPQKHIHLLRLWLEENHWRIVAESLVESKGFFYAVLAAEPGEMRLRPLEAEFGPLLIRQRSAAFLAWLERERIEREELCLSLQKQETAAAVARCRELQEELCRLRSLINGEEFYEPESLI
ncbi:MAG: class I SAM-dependent methyltransferase, partial [Bacillota bacterium]|nr:class I SAM-dependent methyltransferase [Bacillota bacterium]